MSHDETKSSESDSIDQVSAALFSDGPTPSDITLETAANEISNNFLLADGILSSFFPQGIPVDKSFYNIIWQTTVKLGSGKNASEVSGLLWAQAVNTLPDGGGLDLLKALPDKNSQAFFETLDALPTLLKYTDLSADFLATWIVTVRNYLGEDIATGSYFRGLQILAQTFPDKSGEIISILEVDLVDDRTFTILACILGSLRGAEICSSVADLDVRLRCHQDVNCRIVYYRSWLHTGMQRAIADVEFTDLLERPSLCTKPEREEILKVLLALISLESISDESFRIGLRYLHDRISIDGGDFARHSLIHLARELHQRWKNVGLSVGSLPLVDLVPKVLPIPLEHKGTLVELEKSLIFFLNEDRSRFERLLSEIAQKDIKMLIAQFRNQQSFYNLKAAMMGRNNQDLIVEYLLSDSHPIRHLGFVLFQSLGLNYLVCERINRATDDRIAILIFGFQLEPFYDEVIPRFLTAMAPRIENASPDLKSLFFDELIYQCKNLPGICLESLRKNTSKSELIKRAVKEVAEYFKALKPCFRSEINSMEIPGIERSIRMKVAHQSKSMEKQVRSQSIFTQLCSTSYCLYGNTKWQTYIGGSLNEVTEMKTLSSSSEFPRMIGIDPDGMAVRGHNAEKRIRMLLINEKGGVRNDS